MDEVFIWKHKKYPLTRSARFGASPPKNFRFFPTALTQLFASS